MLKFESPMNLLKNVFVKRYIVKERSAQKLTGEKTLEKIVTNSNY